MEFDDMSDSEREAAVITFLKSDSDMLRARIRANLRVVEGKEGFVAQSLREQMIEAHRVLRSLSGAAEDYIKEHF